MGRVSSYSSLLFSQEVVMKARMVSCMYEYMSRSLTHFNVAPILTGKIIEMATLAHSVLPEERARTLVRHMNAAHLVGYTCLSGVYTPDNFVEPFNKELRLLTANEMQSIVTSDRNMTKGGKTCGEIVSWAMKDVQSALNAGEIDSRMASTLRGILLEFRSNMSKMFNDKAQPAVTFFYFHLVSVLCCLYLPFFALNEAQESTSDGYHFTSKEIVHILVLLVQCLYVIGMRILAIKLMNPYEDDVEDLSILTFIKQGWEGSANILNTKMPSEEVDITV